MTEKIPSQLNPQWQEASKKAAFQEKYRQKETFLWQGKEIECIDLQPEETLGKDVFIAVGTPSNWEQMEDFVFRLVSSGRRVTALAHPITDFKESFNYDPQNDRPELVQAFFQEKDLQDTTVIAHSYGLLDIVRKGPQGVGRIIALNPAGLSKNNPVLHLVNSFKSIRKALASKSPQDRKAYLNLVKTLLRQPPMEALKQILDVGRTDLSADLAKFSQMPLIFRNSDDTLVPIKKARAPFRQLETGGDHLGPFLRPDQAEEIIHAVEELEQKEASTK